MKQLAALQQQNRRSNSFRGGSSPLDLMSDGGVKSPASIFWLVLHGVCCLISLVLGFRFSRLVFFLLFTNSSSNYSTTSLFHDPGVNVVVQGETTLLSDMRHQLDGNGNSSLSSTSSSRVVVGRHGILIRPWPHPNASEVMRAHKIMEIVQREQRLQYGVKNPRNVIVVTPTYVRTFQTLHLTGVMHCLMNVPYNVVWIVVEAGGATNETASLIGKSGLKTVHIGLHEKMSVLWEDRHKLEAKMRLRALRYVREEKLDGIVMFADDSNMHMKWFGAASVGILAHSGWYRNLQLPVQGPACNSSDQFVGWHTFDSSPYVEKSARYIGDRAVVLPRKFEWAGFVLNSRLVWKDAEERPEWVKDLDDVMGDREDVESPLSLLKDPSMVEPLGSCGHKVMLWWLRVEARADSKFPSRWIIDPPLDVTVPAKRTPWPDAPPELPSGEKLVTVQEHTEKRPSKTRSRKRSSRGKRKHAANNVDEHHSIRQSAEN
ncbi:unnamed protein product [Withania somnifera]